MHFDNISFEHFSGLRSANLSVDLWNFWYNMAQQCNTDPASGNLERRWHSAVHWHFTWAQVPQPMQQK
jgi:hypothetical protein